MQCNACREELAPGADVCPKCESRAPSPFGSPQAGNVAASAPAKARKDIPLWVCLLFTLAIAAGDWWVLAAPRHANAAFRIGQLSGHACIALLIAALISRMAGMRFRLTWVATFFAMVGILSLQSLSTLARTGAPETTSSGPLAVPFLIWPTGWTAPVSTPMPSVDGVQQTVTLIENGRQTAAISIQLSRQEREASLAEQARGMIEGEAAAVKRSGLSWTFSTPKETTWLSHPALQYDAEMEARTRVRQRIILTKGSPRVVCSMLYVAPVAEFDKHLPDFEMTKIRFVCPE